MSEISVASMLVIGITLLLEKREKERTVGRGKPRRMGGRGNL